MAHSLRGKDRENFIITVCDLNIYLGCICALTCEKNATVEEYIWKTLNNYFQPRKIKFYDKSSGIWKENIKKLNSKDMPMNVKTVLSDAIANQLQYSLFNDSPEVADPIVFFGYRKDKFGNIISPKLVYIDENHVKWVIDSADIEAQNIIPITQKNSESLLKIKKRDSEEKMAN